MWPFKRHVCEPKTEIKTVHVPCVPQSIELVHKHSPYPRPAMLYAETTSDNGMPMRSDPVRVGSSTGPFYLNIPTPWQGEHCRLAVRIFVDY